MSKNDYPIEFIMHARVGDVILNNYAAKKIRELELTNEEKVALFQFINSNVFIQGWDKIIKPKFSYKCNAIDRVKFRGDVVEAGIAFIYYNFGLPAAERYITKQLIKSIKKKLV